MIQIIFFQEDWTSSSCVILLTNKQMGKQTNSQMDMDIYAALHQYM